MVLRKNTFPGIAVLLALLCSILQTSQARDVLATVTGNSSQLSNITMQVYGFQLSGASSFKAATCRRLCQLLGTLSADGAAPAAPAAPYYHSCGSNWQNITTVFRRSFPTECGGFSFFKTLDQAKDYWRQLDQHPQFRALTAADQGLPPMHGHRKSRRLLRGQEDHSEAASHQGSPYWPVGAVTDGGVQVPANHPLVVNFTSLPYIHLLQYNIAPGTNPWQVVEHLHQLALESKAAVPGYHGLELISAAERPDGVQLGPWYTLAGFVSFPTEAILEAYIRYTAFGSKLHASAVTVTTNGAHVMYKAALVDAATYDYPANYGAVNGSSAQQAKHP